MDGDVIGAALIVLSIFGGIAGTIAAAGWAKAERLRAERGGNANTQPAQEAVLAELAAIKQQMGEMQSTSHQFDLSFDAALHRLEGRVDRLETKTAAPSVTTDAPQIQRNGLTP